MSKGDADCISSIYPLETNGGAPMPYCMYFNGGFAVHGSYDIPDYNASHGCVRITPTAAEWLSRNFMNIGTTVIVVPY
jgi:lipoprotein-anchoring transpeptidase ErfK/SrfK